MTGPGNEETRPETMPQVQSTPSQSDTALDPALSLTHTLREAARHGRQAVLLCSFQKDDSVKIDEVLCLDKANGSAVRVVTIDSCVFFEETVQTWRAFEECFGVEIEVFDASNPEQPWSGLEHCWSVARVAGRGPTRPS